MDVTLSVRAFRALYASTDQAWRAWNATYPERRLSRAAFRLEVNG